MTVSSQTRKAGPYSGTGSTGPFTFSFKVFEASDLLVVKANSAGTETTLTLTTDYTVSLNADQNSNPGGTVTLVAALAVGYTMVIGSQVPYLQETDLTNQGGFYPEVITDALDKLTIETQQLKEEVDRSAKLPITSTADADALSADILRLADSADNIDTVATNIDNVNTVAGISGNVTTVAGISGNVTTVAGISSNVTTVAGISSNVTTVAGISAAVSTVATNNANVSTVAANISSVNTTAGSISNVNAVAGDLANIDAVAAELPDILTKVSKTSSTGSAVLPAGTTAQRDGSPLAGYIRFNSTLGKFEGYSGSVWSSVGGGATGGGSDEVFIENGQTVTTNYTISTGKNAISAGPITINSGVTVTVPSGSVWTVV